MQNHETRDSVLSMNVHQACRVGLLLGAELSCGGAGVTVYEENCVTERVSWSLKGCECSEVEKFCTMIFKLTLKSRI